MFRRLMVVFFFVALAGFVAGSGLAEAASISIDGQGKFEILSVSPAGGCTVTNPPQGHPRSGSFTVTGTNENCRVTAVLKSVTHTVKAVGEHCAVNPSSDDVADNGSTTINVTADSGYHISSISGCGGTSYAGSADNYRYNTGNINADCTVTAKCTPDKHTVTPTSLPSGKCTFPAQTYSVNHGASQCFNVGAVQGYKPYDSVRTAANVCPNGALTGSQYCTSNVTTDCNATVECKQYFTVSVRSDESCHATTTSQDVFINNPAVIPFTVEPGVRTVSISGCGGSYNSATKTYTTGNIRANCTVTAACRR